MVAKAMVAATSFHCAPETVRLAAWKIVRAGQNLARPDPAPGTIMVAGDLNTLPDIHVPYISHPAAR